MKLIKFAILVMCIICLATSCDTYKNIPYFADVSDTAKINIIKAPYKDLRIQPDDILYITIQTLDPNSAATVSLMPLAPSSSFPGSAALSSSAVSTSNGAGNVQPTINNFRVDKDGFIELPTMGKVHVAGLSSSEARDSIHLKALDYFKEPTVNVIFANFKVNVLGEVARPGSYVIPSEKATVFDALSLAGDLTVFGKRENVLLIRDSDNVERLIRLNLNNKDLMSSNYLYLRQNDVIYVEPNKAKIANLDAVKTRNYSIGAAVLSVLIIVATRVN